MTDTPSSSDVPTAERWERDCEMLADIVQRLSEAPAEVIYANEDAWWAAYEQLGHIYNDWLMDRLD